jgi:hypothetical protein
LHFIIALCADSMPLLGMRSTGCHHSRKCSLGYRTDKNRSFLLGCIRFFWVSIEMKTWNWKMTLEKSQAWMSSQELYSPHLRTLAPSTQSSLCTHIQPDHCVSGSVLDYVVCSFHSLLSVVS